MMVTDLITSGGVPYMQIRMYTSRSGHGRVAGYDTLALHWPGRETSEQYSAFAVSMPVAETRTSGAGIIRISN